MPVKYTEEFILRSHLRALPQALFLFGDNLIRKGLGGQAKQMRGERNAVGIMTKRYPTMKENAFLSDDDFEFFKTRLAEDIKPVEDHLKSGGWVIIPPIGTGLADLRNKSPLCWNHLVSEIKRLGTIKAKTNG